MNFLLYWSTSLQVTFVVLGFSTLSVLGLYLVRLLVPLETLKKNHEVAGFTFGVLGAFYGLLLAFVIVAVWQRYEQADEMVQTEAMALSTLYRLSKGFVQPTASEMQHALRAYTHHVIDVEWPAMADNKPLDISIDALGLWEIVARYKPTDSRQLMLVDKSFDQLAQVGQDLSLRYLYTRENLPSVVWLVIYSGLFITIGFSYFFGLETFMSQALMCAVFSSLLGLTLLAILELAHPYQGSVTVSDMPFQFSLLRMDALDKIAFGAAGSDAGPSQLAASATSSVPR
jgi:Protein of unknown function (DUF4239)